MTAIQPPTRLFLLRHAEVEERYHLTFGGRIDMGLSALGMRQAGFLADYTLRQKPDVLYASPMKRVQQTIAPLIQSSRLEPQRMEDLREVDFGDWTGLNFDQVKDRWDVDVSQWLALLDGDLIPHAEPSRSFRERVEECIQHILQNHPGQAVAIACHGGVIRRMVASLIEVPLPQMARFSFDYASFSQIDVYPAKNRVALLNYTPWQNSL